MFAEKKIKINKFFILNNFIKLQLLAVNYIGRLKKYGNYL